MIKRHQVTSGATLYAAPQGNVLIGCPPEILKRIINLNLPMPDTIVVPETLHRFHSTQASLEFPFYYFLFVQQGLQRGKKFRVFANKQACQDLADLLKVTLLGPSLNEIKSVEEKLGLTPKINMRMAKDIVAEAESMAVKSKDGRVLQIGEMIDFIPLETGEKVQLYPVAENYDEVIITRTEANCFELSSCGKAFKEDINFSTIQKPIYKLVGEKITAEEKADTETFTIRCLGSSNGFDPNYAANGMLLHFNGKWLLWDCPAYAHEQLDYLGISLEELDGVIISHIHEDHLDAIESLSKIGKTKIYTSPEIFDSMLIKLKAVLRCSYEEAKSYYELAPIYAGETYDLLGATAEFFYSAHAIPTLGMKFSYQVDEKRKSKIFISGDHLSNRKCEELKAKGIISPERVVELDNIPPKNETFDCIFMDAGGGEIHGDPSDHFANPNVIYYVHTSNPISELPKHQKLMASGDYIKIF